MRESDFIKAIDEAFDADDPDRETLLGVYADWLECEGGDSTRAEAWRVMIEAGYRPFKNWAGSAKAAQFESKSRWDWFPHANSWGLLMMRACLPFYNLVVHRTAVDSFFVAFDAGAAGWVRENRDPEYQAPPRTCESCGACCRQQSSPPGYAILMNPNLKDMAPDDDPDLERLNAMPGNLRREIEKYYRRCQKTGDYRDGEPCFWFDQANRRCAHYFWRPQICRDFEIGCDGCLDWRELYKPECETSRYPKAGAIDE